MSTAMVELPITCEMVDAVIQKERQANNRKSQPPELTECQKRAIREEAVYIFNVGPITYTAHMGTTGTFVIPACAPGEQYSIPLTIPGLVMEPVVIIRPDGSSRVMWQMDEGIYVAGQILGSDRRSPIEFGCFVSRSNPAAEEEISAAKEKLRDYFNRYYKES